MLDVAATLSLTDQGSTPLTDSPTSFAQFAGQVLFPRTLADLTSTAQCPACFHRLSSTVCAHCTLDLNHPAAGDLARLSNQTAELIESRGMKPRTAFGPLRTALSGRRISPPLFESMELLGRESTLKRIERLRAAL